MAEFHPIAHIWPWVMEGCASHMLELAPARLPCRPVAVLLSQSAADFELLRIGGETYAPGGLSLANLQQWQGGPVRIPVAHHGPLHAGRPALVLELRNATAFRRTLAGHLEGTQDPYPDTGSTFYQTLMGQRR